jgi:DNA-binding NtrC family response regulator
MEKNILLIDDEAALRRHVSMGLMQQGYHTEPCENGMKGTSFSEIKNTIRTKFKTLDGVLRIKEWPILTLFEA